jgi:hypothetical protein
LFHGRFRVSAFWFCASWTGSAFSSLKKSACLPSTAVDWTVYARRSAIAAVEGYQKALLEYQAVFKSDAAIAADLFLFDRKLLAKLGLVLKKQVPSRPQWQRGSVMAQNNDAHHFQIEDDKAPGLPD